VHVPGRIGAGYKQVTVRRTTGMNAADRWERENLDRTDGDDIQDFTLAPFRHGVDGRLGRQLSEEAIEIMLAGSRTTLFITYLGIKISACIKHQMILE
jgi:hypothetical protein